MRSSIHVWSRCLLSVLFSLALILLPARAGWAGYVEVGSGTGVWFMPLSAYMHDGYWVCMDTYRDVVYLNKEWTSGRALWRTW